MPGLKLKHLSKRGSWRDDVIWQTVLYRLGQNEVTHNDLRPIIRASSRWLSGKLWYLQHNCVGDTIVYHRASNLHLVWWNWLHYSMKMISLAMILWLQHQLRVVLTFNRAGHNILEEPGQFSACRYFGLLYPQVICRHDVDYVSLQYYSPLYHKFQYGGVT